MIAPSPIPQIQQGNISPAASLLGNTTSALTSRINQNRQSDAYLLANLLGQVGGGVREKLQAGRQNELDKAKFERELPVKLIGAIPQLQVQKQNFLLQGNQAGANQIDEIFGVITRGAFGLGDGDTEAKIKGIEPTVTPPDQTAGGQGPYPTIPGGSQPINPPQGQFSTRGSLNPSVLVAGENLPLEEKRASVVEGRAKTQPYVERQIEEAQNVVMDAKTGIVAQIPSASGSQQTKPLEMSPKIFDAQTALRAPDGTLNDVGKEVNKSTVQIRSKVNQIEKQLKETLKLMSDLDLNQAQRFALQNGSVDLVPGLNSAQKVKAALLKNKYQNLKQFILGIASEVNEGRPTDIDFRMIEVSWPDLSASEETIAAASVERLMEFKGNLLDKEIALTQTGSFNADVKDYVDLFGEYQFGESPQTDEQIINNTLKRLTGKGLKEFIGTSSGVGTLDSSNPSQVAAPTQPAPQPVTQPAQTNNGGSLLERLQFLKQQGVF